MSIFDADVDDAAIEKFKAMSHDELLNALEVCKESRPELALVIYAEIHVRFYDGKQYKESGSWLFKLIEYILERDLASKQEMQFLHPLLKLNYSSLIYDGQISSVLEISKSLVVLYSRLGRDVEFVEATLERCAYLAQDNQFDAVIREANEALGVAKVIESFELAGQCALIISIAHFRENDIDSSDLLDQHLHAAIEFADIALELFENSGNTLMVETALATIAKNYTYLQSYASALECIERSIALHENLRETKEFSLKVFLDYRCLQGKLLRKLGRLEEAKEILETAFEFSTSVFPSGPPDPKTNEVTWDPERLSVVVPSLRMELSWTLVEIDNLEGAWEEFAQTSRFFYGYHTPKSIEAAYGLAYLLWKRKRHAVSLRVCNEILDGRINIYPWSGEGIFSEEGDVKILELIDKHSRPLKEGEGRHKSMESLRREEMAIWWIVISQTALNYQALNQWQESLDVLEKVNDFVDYIPSAEEAAQVEYLRANALTKLQKLDEAKSKLEEIIEYAPDDDFSSGLANALWLRAEKFGSSDPKQDRKRAIEIWSQAGTENFKTAWREAPEKAATEYSER